MPRVKAQSAFLSSARVIQISRGITMALLNSLSTRDKIGEFVNTVDLDEVAHNEPPHLDLHCLPSSL